MEKTICWIWMIVSVAISIVFATPFQYLVDCFWVGEGNCGQKAMLDRAPLGDLYTDSKHAPQIWDYASDLALSYHSPSRTISVYVCVNKTLETVETRSESQNKSQEVIQESSRRCGFCAYKTRPRIFRNTPTPTLDSYLMVQHIYMKGARWKLYGTCLYSHPATLTLLNARSAFWSWP